MGFNLLEESRNGKTTRKTVFIVTFKLISCYEFLLLCYVLRCRMCSVLLL